MCLPLQQSASACNNVTKIHTSGKNAFKRLRRIQGHMQVVMIRYTKPSYLIHLYTRIS